MATFFVKLSVGSLVVASALAVASTAQADSTNSLTATAEQSTASVSAKGSFLTAVCEETSVNGDWKQNGRGRVVVKAESTFVDVVRRNSAGSWVSTTRVAAGSQEILDYYAPTPDKQANYTLRASDGTNITQPFSAPYCRV